MALLGGLHLPSLQSRSHDISSICPSQKWSGSGGKVRSCADGTRRSAASMGQVQGCPCDRGSTAYKVKSIIAFSPKEKGAVAPFHNTDELFFYSDGSGNARATRWID